jgi:hypothetical protein
VSKSKGHQRLATGFTVGSDQAEWDPLLSESFFESGHYKALSAGDDERCFIVGRTGSGKSAILRRIEDENPDHVIRIKPDDLALLYIADLGVMKFLTAMDVHMDLLFTALWKHVFLVEIIRHRYKINTQETRQTIFATLRDKLARDRTKADALKYLTDFEGKFWQGTEERVREITTKLEERISSESGANVSIGMLGDLRSGRSDGIVQTVEECAELVSRYQRIVNDTQIARLNKMITILDDDILDSSQNFTYILVDDLDKDWVDERILNDLIRCLFRVVVDLKEASNLKVIVALRTNIFEQLNFGSRTGGQEEKYRSFTLRMRWEVSELEQLLSARARAAGGRHGLKSISAVSDLLPGSNSTRGNALSHILSRTLMRPRDAISYLNEALVLAAGKERLSWDVINRAERPYSTNRLLALRDEWKPSYPDIDKVFKLFEGQHEAIGLAELVRILDDAALLPADPKFQGARWMTEMTSELWSGSRNSEWFEDYYDLVRLLFNIGFVGVTRSGGSDPVYVYDDPQFAERVSNFKSVVTVHVHPAFRAALDIQARRPKRRRT